MRNKKYFMLGVLIFLFGISVVTGLPIKGPTDEVPVEGSSFWVGEKINGEFYFYVYKNGLWYFSTDVKADYKCPIRTWLDPGQQDVLNMWYSGNSGKGDSTDNYVTRDIRETVFACYLRVIASSLDFPVAAAVQTDIGESFNLNSGAVSVSGVEYFNITYSSEDILEKGVGIVFLSLNSFLKIENNTFTNILPFTDPGKPPYIYLDKEGKIIRADFTVNEIGGNYNFNGKEIFVPPRARVFFDRRYILTTDISAQTTNGIDIQLETGSDLTQFSDLLNFNQETFSQIYRGENIHFKDFVLEKGEIMFESEGVILRGSREDTVVTWNDFRIDISDSDGNFLISNSNVNLDNYEGSWIRRNNINSLEISSIDNEEVRVNVLPGNDFFNTFKTDEQGNLVPNEDSRLNFVISNNNHLKFEKDEGGIVLNPGKGEFRMVNGKNAIRVRYGTISDQDISDLSNLEQKDYESILLEIDSQSFLRDESGDFINSGGLIFGDDNSYSYMENNRPRITMVYDSEDSIEGN